MTRSEVRALDVFASPFRDALLGDACVCDIAGEYAEPGYERDGHGPIVTGNWNDRTRYNAETQKRETVDTRPSRIARVLTDRYGCTLEWLDEWCTCSECGRLVRTQPDNWWWTPSFTVGDGELLCNECNECNEGSET